MGNNRTLESFESQADLDSYILKREATAVAGATKGFAEAVRGPRGDEVVAKGKEAVADWLENAADMIALIFDVNPG